MAVAIKHILADYKIAQQKKEEEEKQKKSRGSEKNKQGGV